MDVPPPPEGLPDRTYHRARATRKPLLATVVFTAVGALVVLRWKPFRVEVAGPSMRPALRAGEWALAVGRARARRGDVVVVERPDRPGVEIVKRIVAVPGDVAPDGAILAADRFWVEGDDAAHSTDSRHFGPVPRSSIRARVVLVYRPWERRRIV